MFIYVFFFVMIRRPPRSTRTDTLFPYTTLFRSRGDLEQVDRQLGVPLDDWRGRSTGTPLRAFRPAWLFGHADSSIAVAPGLGPTEFTYFARLCDHADSHPTVPPGLGRSEVRRVGIECVRTVSSRCAATQSKNKSHVTIVE